MVGPDVEGDEFDEVDEEEKTDPTVVYDVIDTPSPGVVTIMSSGDQQLILRVTGDDVGITITIPADTDEPATMEYGILVARSALVEALRDAGLFEQRESTDLE